MQRATGGGHKLRWPHHRSLLDFESDGRQRVNLYITRNLKRTHLIHIGLVAGFLGCSSGVPDAPSPEPLEAPVVEPEPAPEPLPFIDPPAPSDESWKIPDYGRYEAPFPYLPDEDRRHSRSVGGVTDGYMVGARYLPLPHPHLQVLPRQFERGFQYAGDPMIELLVDAAMHVGEEFQDSAVPLGNLSRRGGGNVPQSVSHNSGRDADIAFFVLDEEGNPTVPPDLLSMDAQGRYEGPVDDEVEDGPKLVLQFDAPRNWRLVEGLIESDAADLQYIFVSRPLRRMLLDEARRQNASAQTIEIARQVLVQPGGNALPHDDHFHVRIHCTARDFAAGCRERGRAGPTFRADYHDLSEIIDRATALLDDDEPQWRRDAVRRLALLDDHHRLQGRFVDLIDDPDPTVRAAAVRALRAHRPAFEPLKARLADEPSPPVFAEIIDALVEFGDRAAPVLLDAIDSAQWIEFGQATSIPTIAFVADGLARLQAAEAVPYLIDALATAEPQARTSLVHALRLLTNHRLAPNDALRDDARVDEVVGAWGQWWDEYGDQDRDIWVTAGFQQSGFEIDGLDMGDVWELCRAISETPHLNFNAQLALKQLAGQSPGSLQWDPYDANFYWRRWFERRKDRLDLPPMPEELSTADGYTKPE